MANIHPHPATAATNSTINFQAKLMSAAGAIAADGNYNVEFNLYSALSGGTSLWTEDRLVNTSTSVRVVNGYLTVNLGSVNAFPTTINWDQNLYLGMTVRGTNNCTPFSTGCTTPGDAEMSPRLALTATPYAFSAGKLSQLNGSNTSTLTIQGSSTTVQNFVIPDQGTAGTYNLLTSSAASTGFVQLQGSTPGTAQTGNLNINGTAITGTLGANNLYINGTGILQTYTMPGGSTISTKFNVGNYAVASGDSITAVGLTSSSNAAAHGITVYDARASGNHQASIGVSNPNQTDIFGLSWDGTNTTAHLETTFTSGSSSSVQVNSGDSSGTGTTSGNVSVQSGNITGITSTSGNVTLQSGGTNGTNSNSGSVSILTGSANGTNGSSGAIGIDVGYKNGTGTTGAITIGGANASAITIGNVTTATAQTINLGNSPIASSSTTIVIGSTIAGTTTLQSAGGVSISSLLSANAGLTVSNGGNFAVQKTASDFSVAGSTTDAAFGTGGYVRLTGASTQTINGIAGGTNGRVLTIVNAAGQAAIIKNLSGGAGNQVITGTGADLSLSASASITLVYDSGSSAWRVSGQAVGSSVVAVGAISGTSNANGATVTGTTLNLTAADNVNGGVVTNTTQSFLGLKTFTSGIASSGGAVTLQGNTTSTLTTTAGTLSVQGFGTTTLSTADQSAASTSSANLVLNSGNANGTTSTAGNVTIDVGASTTSNGSILIGTAARAQTITIGNTSGGTLTLGQNAGTVIVNGTNFDVSNTGVVTLAGSQAQDINTASAGTATSITIQPGNSTTNSGTGSALVLKGSNQTGTTSIGGAVNITGGSGTTTNGATSINASFNAVANINTGTSTGAVNIGNSAAGAIAIQSSSTIGLTATTTTVTGSLTQLTGVVSLTGNNNSSLTTTTGTLTLQSASTLGISTTNTTTSAGITIQTGNSSAGTAGTVTIDNGTSSTGTGTIAIGNSAIAHSIQIGTGAAIQTVSIGSTNGTSALVLNAGTGNLSIQTQGGTLGIGNNSVAQTLNIGNTTGATAVSIQAGTGNVNLITNNSAAGTTVKTNTNSTTAFQVQTSGSVSVFKVDTVAPAVTVNSGNIIVTAITAPATETATLTTTGGSLANGTDYYYKVAAYNASGTSVAAITTPSVLTTSNTNSRITVAWSTIPAATGYYVYRSNDSGVNYYRIDAGNTTSINDNGSTYTWSGTNYRDSSRSISDSGSINITIGSSINLGNQGQLYQTANDSNLFLSNYATGATTTVQASGFAFQNTTGNSYNTDFSINGTGSAVFRNISNSSTAFQVQNAGGAASALTVDTSTLTVTVSKLVATSNITVNGHIVSGGTAPTIAAGTAACTTPTVTIAGTDTAGLISITSGTGCGTTGKLATITFSTAFGAAPRVTLTAATSTAAGLTQIYVNSATTSTTVFDINSNTAPANSTAYKWYYHVVQ